MEGNNIHCVTKISEKCTGLAQLDGFVQTLSGCSHEFLGFIIDPSNRIGLIEIAEETCADGQGNFLGLKTRVSRTIFVQRNI